jgi:hypothetical protein
MFATLSHGKLTSWEQVVAANGHNGRTIEVPNARSDGHPPVEMIERPGSDLTERMRGRLAEVGIKKPRANAVLGFEDIFGASPGYWAERYPDGWQAVPVAELMQDPLVLAVTDFAQQKHGKDNVVSITWHLDEKTPHAHVVSLPLVTREHKRRGRKRKDGSVPEPVLKTTLAADQVRGGSKYALEKEHDEWAAFVAHLGLKRGRRGSELSAEEQRDRRLRDPQASLEGEKRAAERMTAIQQSAQAMVQLIDMGKKDRDGLIEEGRAQAAAKLASAKAEAEQIRGAALVEAAQARAATDQRASELAQRERALVIEKARAETLIQQDRAQAAAKLAGADVDAERIRKAALAEAAEVKAKEDQRTEELDRRERALAQRTAADQARITDDRRQLEVAIAKIRATSAAEKRVIEEKTRNLDIREAKLADKETRVDRLLAELDPLIDRVRSVLERVKDAPAEIRRWFEPVTKLATPISSVLQQAAALEKDKDLARVKSKGPRQSATEDDLHIQAAYAAQKGGKGL